MVLLYHFNLTAGILWTCFVLTSVIPENASAKDSLSNAECQL